MNQKNHRPIAARWTAIAIACALLAGVPTRTQSQSLLNLNLGQTTQTVSQLGKVSSDLLNQVLGAALGARVNVIVQSNGPWSPLLDTVIALSGGQITSSYSNLNLKAVNLPASSVLALALNNQIDFISPDRTVRLLGHLSTTTGANAAATSVGRSDLDGSEVGIAIIDSGIYNSHQSFLGSNSAIRIVASKDFTGERRTDDPYAELMSPASRQEMLVSRVAPTWASRPMPI
ncbi:MAG: hypothetical protein ACR2LM_19815 [Pyrinomonadaceae bacterium]